MSACPHCHQRLIEIDHYNERLIGCIECNWKENRALAAWVAEQRSLHKEGKLPSVRKAQLDALRFVWAVNESAWEITFAELKQYKDRFGDCRVSRGSDEHRSLAAWVNNQRHLFRDGRLSSARKARLDELGFDWNLRESIGRPCTLSWSVSSNGLATAMFLKISRV